jgi:hypothetical protein
MNLVIRYLPPNLIFWKLLTCIHGQVCMKMFYEGFNVIVVKKGGLWWYFFYERVLLRMH